MDKKYLKGEKRLAAENIFVVLKWIREDLEQTVKQIGGLCDYIERNLPTLLIKEDDDGN